jgi:hypothetical protein
MDQIEKNLARTLNLVVISLNDYELSDYVDRIYPIEIEINGITDTAWSASCLVMHLEFDSECRLRTKVSGKRDNFYFAIV